jgi:signal transduction histidine kinase
LSDVWRKAWTALAPARGDRDVRLDEVFDTADLQCSIASPRMEQAFYNILENALDACADPAVITIRTFEAAHGGQPALAISFRDNGPGLTTEQQEKILQPFYTTKTKGTGLGMPIVVRIVEAHGGRLEVVNRPPGAEFVITLPR